MDYLQMTDKHEAAVAYESFTNLNVTGSNPASCFLYGCDWYEKQIIGLQSASPDELLERVNKAQSELELLQLSTALLANAKRYTPDVPGVISAAIGQRASFLAASFINSQCFNHGTP